jgi:hypothetical protein
MVDVVRWRLNFGRDSGELYLCFLQCLSRLSSTMASADVPQASERLHCCGYLYDQSVQSLRPDT